MDLVTVCNSKDFFACANRLITSFLKFYPQSKVILCVFGDMAKMACRASDTLEVVEVPQDCEHAWNPRLYYYKSAALKIGLDRCRDSVIWLDSRNLVVDRMIEVEEWVEKVGRFFDQYPNEEFYEIKRYTAARCVEKMGLTQERIAKWYGYQSLIQAYAKSSENIKFVDAMVEYMKDPEIAGPSNYLDKPDGPDSYVRHHRNDLSVLSLLIPQYGFDQPYDYEKSRRYGDRPTYERFGGCNGYDWKPRILTRQP